MWVYFQPNPCGRSVADCNIRALSAVTGLSWEEAFDILAYNAKRMCDMPSADSVMAAVLRQYGFRRRNIPNTCPTCYTVKQYCSDNPIGVNVVGLGGHVTAVIDGNIYDSWDTSNEIPVYVWTKED